MINKKLSVVILNWNGKELMEKFLPSVIANTPKDWCEVIVADNGSTDSSLGMLKKKFPTVKLISFNHNYGFAEGYNRALAELDSEYTVLLNSDIEVTSGWVEVPVAAMDADPSVACVQPKIRAEKNKAYFEYAGAAGGFMDRYGYPYCRGRILSCVEKDEGQYDTPQSILWASGACLFIRTAVYKEVGGLDSGFFAHQEEIDMCWRLRTRGYKLLCTPQSVIYHVGGATLNAENPRKTFLNFRNNLLMLYKNLPAKDLKHIMHVRFWLDYVAALKFLLTGHFSNAKAVYEARKAFARLLPEYKSKREENIQKTVLTEIPELMHKSLIAEFYLKGKKHYSDF